MWKWLFDAHHLLGAAVEVIDPQFGLLTSPPSVISGLRQESGRPTDESLQPAIVQSLTSATPSMTTSGGLRVSCTPIVAAGSVEGAVLVVADVNQSLGSRELARAGALLANAIEDQLSRPLEEHRGSLHQLSALYQLLQSGITSGSEHEVLRSFAEALSIWEEIEVVAYRADLDGRYSLEMLLPGSDPAMYPETFDRDLFEDGSLVLRLSVQQRHDLGFAGVGETALVHLMTDGGPRLIAMNAASDAANRERFELYLAALGHALNAVVGVETSRLTWAVMQQFVGGETPQLAATRALSEISAALNARGFIVVRRPDDVPVLTAGDPPVIDMPWTAFANATTLRARVAAPVPFQAFCEMRTMTDRGFTRRDGRLFEAAVGTFSTWLNSAAPQLISRDARERRGVAQSFDQILDRYARAAHASNDPASLILISGPTVPASLQQVHEWVKRLRPQLRPTDLAGRLTSGEVGILLLQTPQAGAHVVGRRLARALEISLLHEERVRIGVATQVGEMASGEALIERARLHPLDDVSAAG